MKLGKFSWSVERVTVRVRDANGPRGRSDRECTAKVVLSGSLVSSSSGEAHGCMSPLTRPCTPLRKPSDEAWADVA
jgi:hypothetical protein